MTNSFKSYVEQGSELKSHSSALTNERISAILSAYDTEILVARNDRKLTLESVMRAYNTAHILWSNIRTLVRYFPDCRLTLGIETPTDGVYKLDVVDDLIDETIEKIELKKTPYTRRIRRNIIRQIEYIVSMSRDVLQYFKFNFRTDNRQNPDVFSAVNNDFIPDENTIRQLAENVGARHKVDFEHFERQLGTTIFVKKDERDEDN